MAFVKYTVALLCVGLLTAPGRAQNETQFSLFPAVDSGMLSNSLGWSLDCLTAMNTTLSCDPDLFRMTGQIDMYLWSSDNLTTLCEDDCLDGSSDWITTVEAACSGQTYSAGGKLVPVNSIPLRYVEGINLACAKSDNLPLNWTSNPITNDESLVDDDLGNPNSTTPIDPLTGDIVLNPDDLPPPDTVPGVDDPYGPNNITDVSIGQEPKWCFIESQNWPGIDPEPDCNNNPNSTFCTDPDSMNRLANLYYDSVLCDPCYLIVLWYRVNSVFLPDTDASDWLIEQYQDIQDVCQVVMPDTVIRAPLDYASAPNITYLLPGTDPAENSTDSNNGTTCRGQTISPGTGCDGLSQNYGVTTGDLQAASGTDDCSFTGTLCVPAACTLQRVGSNTSCNGLAASYATSTLNVTASLFLSWNPNIMGLCDSLTEGQFVCSAPPGGVFTLPPPINGTNTDAASQERGGSGNSNPDGPLGANGPTANSTNSAPTQVGIASDCIKFAYVSSGDTCYEFTQSFGISMAQLTAWNPALGAPDGHNCTTQFWIGYDYCVGTESSQSSSSTSSSQTTSSKISSSTISLAYPTQSGISAYCKSYKNAVAGDYCSKFASDNGITTDELYAWNTILGSGGANCSTQFQAGVDYCIGISAPGPTQSGIISSCNNYLMANPGGSCSAFATRAGISLANLYSWNPVLGANGANCSTSFWGNEYYCVGISSTASVAAPTSTKTTVTAPGATQSGIVANCNKYLMANAGGTCTAFASRAGITTAQLYSWNPVLGSSGQNCASSFWGDEYYCVGVGS